MLHMLNWSESGDVFILHYCVVKVPKWSSISFQILAPCPPKTFFIVHFAFLMQIMGMC